MNGTLIKKHWIIHVSVWLSYLLLLVWLYSESRGYEHNTAKSIFTVLIQVIVFYLNFYFLLPRYFENKKHLQYSLFAFATLVISVALFYIFDKISLDMEYRRAMAENDFSRLPRELRGHGRNLHPGPWAAPWKFTFIWRSLLFNGFFVVIALFISTIYHNLLINQKKEKESLKLLSQVKDAESKMLKSQINPHFLFNTLNNIYSMAQMKSDQTADAVHRLSDMLRYVIYDCNQPYVKLGQEINYIKSYIELQLLKDERMENIKYNLDEINENLMIAPMLLIPFIENSFKHSNIEDTSHSWIEIELKTENSRLQLKVRNSLSSGRVSKDSTGGVGLGNVQKRLDILYPGRHQLVIEQTLREYMVELMVNLDEN
jgi:hypothetical protein